MKKNYFYLFFLIFGLFYNIKSHAQLPIVANDDVVNNINSAQAGFAYNAFLTNDTLNGNPIGGSAVFVTQISTTNPGVIVSGSLISVAQGTPAGTYTIVYQICQSNFPNNCDTATITVNVCNQPLATIAPVNCETPGTMVINNLPAEGTWEISINYNGVLSPNPITGTGTTHTLTNLAPGNYNLIVTNSQGCSSPNLYYYLGNINGIDADVVGTYVDLNNDGIVSIGDIISYEIEVTNTTTCQMAPLDVTYENWDGNVTVFDGYIPSLPGGETVTVTAYYSITQSDISNGQTIHNWFAVQGNFEGFVAYTKAFDEEGVVLNIPDGFKLNAFVDQNTNGIQDNNEVDFSLGYFQYTINDSTTPQQLYNTNNPIIYETNPFTTYDVTFVIYPEYAAYYNLVTATHNDISIAGNPGITNYNFPITTTNYSDLSVHLYSGSTATPGFPYINYITYTNHSPQTIPSGTITLLKDTAYPITTNQNITTTLDGFTFDFTNLLPFETRTMTFSMQIPTIPTVSLGDPVGLVASISFVEGDVVLENNVSIVNTVIVGSYDPNDKSESNGGKILHLAFTSNDYLDYTIRFENTGTANAFTVKVTDILDEKLDETSIRMINASHNYILERAGSELTWTFNNIQLPPSVPNTQTGHGYIAFKVKPKPGYTVGDIIQNTASIFFDFNPAIITNTTSTEFVATLNTNDFSANDFKAYPNPVKNLLNITSNDFPIEMITVNDLLGKTILTKTIHSNSCIIDVSGFSAGIYVVKAISTHGEKTFKIIKE